MAEPTPTDIADIRQDNSFTRAQILAGVANAENHIFFASDTGDVFISDPSGNIKEYKASYQETSDPLVTSDSANGYNTMETWLNTASGAYYICIDNTPGAAVWLYILGGFISEALTGTVDGVNTTFTIPSGDVVNDEGMAFWNGRLADDNYTITGDTVEFSVAPATGTKLWFVGNVNLTSNVKIVKAQNYLLVAETGGDFDDLAAAVAFTGATSASNRWAIDVAPGTYEITGTITGKEYLSIRGLGDLQTVRLTHLTPNVNMFEMVNLFTISGVSFHGVTGTGYAVSHTVAGLSSIARCIFSDCENGININHASANFTADNIGFVSTTATTAKGVFVESGSAIINGIRSVAGDVTTLIEGTGVGSIIDITSLKSFNPGLLTGIYMRDLCRCVASNISIVGSLDGVVVQGGANVKINGGAIFNCGQDGLRINDTGSNTDVTVQSMNIEGSTQWDINLLSATCTLSGSGQISGDLVNRVPGVRMIMGNITLKEDDEGFDVLGELHVGSPEKGAESSQGRGDSYTRGMFVFEYDGADFTDVSTEARSASVSTFTIPGLTADNAVYIASSLKDSETLEFLEHPGIKAKIDTACVPGAGEIVIEYWNGASWAEVNGFEVDEEQGRFPHAKDYFERTGSAHIRYNSQLVIDSWTKNDPIVPALGTSYYWARFRVATEIDTAPIFEQFKLHTDTFEPNSDGWLEFRGQARSIGQLPVNLSGASPFAGNMQNQSLWVNEDVAVGFTTNKFTATSDITGVNGFLPYDCDTSSPLKLIWKGVPSASATIEFTVRMFHVADGDTAYTSNPALAPGLITEIVSRAVTVNIFEFFEVDLDVSNIVSRRDGGFGDHVWISVQATTLSGNFSISGSQVTYTKWCEGGHV
jgi:hypothetical protein